MKCREIFDTTQSASFLISLADIIKRFKSTWSHHLSSCSIKIITRTLGRINIKTPDPIRDYTKTSIWDIHYNIIMLQLSSVITNLSDRFRLPVTWPVWGQPQIHSYSKQAPYQPFGTEEVWIRFYRSLPLRGAGDLGRFVTFLLFACTTPTFLCRSNHVFTRVCMVNSCKIINCWITASIRQMPSSSYEYSIIVFIISLFHISQCTVIGCVYGGRLHN